MAKDRSYTWLWIAAGIGAAYLVGRAAIKSELVKKLLAQPEAEQARRIRALYEASTPEARQGIDEFYEEIGLPRPF